MSTKAGFEAALRHFQHADDRNEDHVATIRAHERAQAKEIAKLKADLQIARNDLKIAQRCMMIENSVTDHWQEKAEFWRERCAIVRERRDKRIAKLERERDEYKEKAEFWRMGNDAWKSYAGQYAGERDALRTRIESAPKAWVERRFASEGGWSWRVWFEKQPKGGDYVEAHAVPVEHDEPDDEGRVIPALQKLFSEPSVLEEHTATLPRAHAVIRDGQVVAMARREDYVEYLKKVFGDEVKEVVVVEIGKEPDR